ncbi:MAG: hypothetical protein KIH01_07180 [Candidatus Freyarchaeota archaeon]|nr:hypothetical protein [Candidatus Jordarchaeia archaeon]
MTVMVDDAGVGDPVGGCVIGVLEVGSKRFVWDVISVRFFQEPFFREKRYLEEALNVVLRCFEEVGVGEGELVKVCRGDVFRLVRRRLAEKFRVEEVKVEGELQVLVEEAYISYLSGLGVPRSILTVESGKERFIRLLRWIYEAPEERLRLAKTGWRSWRKLDRWGRRLARRD